MKWLVPIIIITLLFVLQLAISDMNLWLGVPNLLLCYVSVMLLYRGLNEVLLISIFAGILLDYFSGLPDGVMVLSMLAATAAAYYLGNMVSAQKLSNFLILFYILFSTMGFFLFVLIATEVLAVFGLVSRMDWDGLLTRKLGADVIFNLIFLYPIFWLYETQIIVLRKFNKNESF
ncbi:MAG TPA: hypothetical protein VEC17_02640 [Candidatus Binatia bacterium]|nr:hypothetical protein [Candidatus Binatia bacterium]